MAEQEILVALAGQPNVGKSSLINRISGSNLKVGNFAGVTIEKAKATVLYRGYKISIIDLPGTYSLNQYSPEEKITQDFLTQEAYDLILNVADSTNLERNLSLTAQILELDRKTLLALNMDDEAQKEGIQIDHKLLSSILGIPILKTSTKEDMTPLLDAIIALHTQAFSPSKRSYSEAIEEGLKEIEDFLGLKQYPCIAQALQEQRISGFRQLALLLLQQNEAIYALLSSKPCWVELSPLVAKYIAHICAISQANSMQEVFALDHYAYAKGASLEVQKRSKSPQDITQKLDAILLNKYLGIPIFLFLMWLLFQATFTLGAIPKDSIDAGFGALGEWIQANLSSEELASLLADGVIGGVGAVVSFLPDILILFLGIVLLESTGYMARIAFLLDGFFHRFGLHGKSFIPLVTGFGCSVPAFMSTRMLKNRSDKLLTLFIINFMSCSARLPVYVLFIGAFFPHSQSGNILFGIYLLGAIIGLVFAKLLKLTAFRGVDEPFVMEMPKYRIPSLKLISFSVWNKAKMYLRKAGTFILIASMLIWFAGKYPQDTQIAEQYQKKIQTLQEQPQTQERQEEIDQLQNEQNALLLEHTYLGHFGEAISPLFAPFDFDWRLSVSLVTGLAAKEVMISTLGVLYSLGEDLDETSQSLMGILQEKISIPSAIAFLLFVMFYNPCFAATIVFGKEAGGTKYTLLLFVFTTLVAYGFALLGFQIASLVF